MQINAFYLRWRSMAARILLCTILLVAGVSEIAGLGWAGVEGLTFKFVAPPVQDEVKLVHGPSTE